MKIKINQILFVLVGVWMGTLTIKAQVQSSHPELRDTSKATKGVKSFMKGELQVNLSGGVTYNVPIDVPKGVNDFAPNLSLAYSSDGGNGQAGWGWNLVGMSMITQGGKSKRIDGYYEGPQGDANDPYYLDGQRLIQVGNTTSYELEKISPIKVTKTTDTTFMVQYTDGKVAYYRKLVAGQFYVDSIVDAYDNAIVYEYSVRLNTPYLEKVKYGNKVSMNGRLMYPYQVHFDRYYRGLPVSMYRNGVRYENREIVGKILVYSWDGTNELLMYRRYQLTHDSTTLGQERLRLLKVYNQAGESLEQLKFDYTDQQEGAKLESYQTKNAGFSAGAEGIKAMAMGDFYGDGRVTAVYSDGKQIKNSRLGDLNLPIAVSGEIYLSSGKIKMPDGKISERDQLIVVDVTANNYSSLVPINGSYFRMIEVKIYAFDLNNIFQPVVSSVYIPRGFECVTSNIIPPYVSSIYGDYGKYMEYLKTHIPATVEFTHVDLSDIMQVSDLNKDGLVDILIKTDTRGLANSVMPIRYAGSYYYYCQGVEFGNSLKKLHLIEFGKQGNQSRVIQPIDFNNSYSLRGVSAIEFDGDGSPEFFEKNDSSYNIFKINFAIPGSSVNLINSGTLNNYPKDAPLVFGDYNGDGLTDFLIPNKVYDLTNSSISEVTGSIGNDQLLWTQYICTGNTSNGQGFLVRTKDFTKERLFYVKHSGRNLLYEIGYDDSDFWESFYNGPKLYTKTTSEYGAATVFAMDFNNDGRTDLISYSNFGQIKNNDDRSKSVSNMELQSVGLLPYIASFEKYKSYTYPECVTCKECSLGGTSDQAYARFEQCQREKERCEIARIDCIKKSTSQSFVMVPHHYDYANRIRYHQNVYDPNEEFAIKAEPLATVDLSDKQISPYSFFINETKQNGLVSYKTKMTLVDPLTMNSYVSEIHGGHFFENNLLSVDNSSGVVQEVEYAPLQEEYTPAHLLEQDIKIKNPYYSYQPAKFDNSNYKYPYHIHKHIPMKFMVAKVTTRFDGKAVTKEYRYENAIQHLDGQGFMGFQTTYVSDPYESEYKGEQTNSYVLKPNQSKLYWKINRMDPYKEGSTIYSFYGSLDGSDKITSTNKYYKQLIKGKSYLYVDSAESSTDYLRAGVLSQKIYTYDITNYLITKIRTEVGLGSDDKYTTEDTFRYDVVKRNGNHYFSGKVSEMGETTSAYNDQYSTKTKYTFNERGAVATETKYGNGTIEAEAITKSYTYDRYGNRLSEEVSVNGLPSLKTSYTYDASQRYAVSVTTPDGLTSRKEVDAFGRTVKEISPLDASLFTVHSYDGWGNPVRSVGYLNDTTTLLTYRLKNGNYAITTIKRGSPEAIVVYDKLDRKIETRKQSLNGKWVITRTGYDFFGKVIRKSEPFFESDTLTKPIYWNSTEYDDYGRPKGEYYYTGKSVTTQYDPLSLSVTVKDGDGTLTRIQTMNVMGKVKEQIEQPKQGEEQKITYRYYANGSLRSSTYGKIVVSIKQDAWGNKTELNDPSAGIYRYTYDALGRKLSETTPKGVTSYVYDALGRMKSEHVRSRSRANHVDSSYLNTWYDYDAKSLPVGMRGSNGKDTFVYKTSYDRYYRISEKQEVHPKFVHTTRWSYDKYGRDSAVFSSVKVGSRNAVGTQVQKLYDGNGFLYATRDLVTGKIIQVIDEVNEKGGLLQASWGNGYVVRKEYNDLFPSSIKHTKGGEVALDMSYTFDAKRNLLEKRINRSFGVEISEEFTYDNYDRLVLEKVGGDTLNYHQYADDGRILQNRSLGAYRYKDSSYKLEGVSLNAKGDSVQAVRGGKLRPYIRYGAYKQVVFIASKVERINYEYNLLRERSVMYYGDTLRDKEAQPLRKYYSSDKGVEIKEDKRKGTLEILMYMDGDPYSATALKRFYYSDTLRATATDSSEYYLHRDYQGTILAVSDGGGNVLEKRRFDAWGSLVKAWNKTYGDSVMLLVLDRGYTGHEHLQRVGMIHMNGRIYDPMLRQFLAPDNFIQDPYNSQNYNRFGYVLNNPLMYVDPSGEVIPGLVVAIMIGVAIATAMHVINNLAQGIPVWWGIGKAVVMGAVSSAISFGIGEIATGIVSVAEKALFQAAAHGVSGGLMNVLNGGDFLSGFASGAVSSLLSSGFSKLGGDLKFSKNLIKVGMIAVGGLSGGLSSVIAGGNFWDGMRQGLITSALNHSLHETKNGLSKIFQKGTDANNPPKEEAKPQPSESKSNKTFGVLASDGNSSGGTSSTQTALDVSLKVTDALDKSITLTEGVMIGAQKISDPAGKYPITTKIPVLSTLGQITSVAGMANDFKDFWQTGNAYYLIKGSSTAVAYYFGGAELGIIVSLTQMTVDASFALYEYFKNAPPSNNNINNSK